MIPVICLRQCNTIDAMNTLVYAFRTFRPIDELKKINSDIFVFSKLKEDFKRFEELLDKKPFRILSVAITKGPSRLEPLAINRFNEGNIITGGKELLPLHVPANRPAGLRIASKPTRSFCNWTMYRIQHVIIKHGYTTELVFVHVNVKDIDELRSLIKKDDI